MVQYPNSVGFFSKKVFFVFILSASLTFSYVSLDAPLEKDSFSIWTGSLEIMQSTTTTGFSLASRIITLSHERKVNRIMANTVDVIIRLIPMYFILMWW